MSENNECTVNGTTPSNHINVTISSPSSDSEITIVSTTPMPNNANANGLTIGGHKPNSNVIEYQPKRRVSIASDTLMEGRYNGGGGYDNLAFEQYPKRKISQASLNSHTDHGPVRRKSILVNATHDNESDHGSISDKDKPYRQSALDSFNAKITQHQPGIPSKSAELEQSWIYNCCLKCHSDDHTPSWEPPFWAKFCPYPLCPSFRSFSRFCVLILIGILIWITAYVIIGDSAAPGGQLFSLVVLTVAANVGGWLISLTTLPRLIGMLLVGILFQNIGWVDIDGDFTVVTGHLRKFALTIILIRAGLEMEPEAFRKVYKTILKLGIVPWLIEGSACAVLTHFLMDLPWMWALLLGSIFAAVSPAVVVPCLFRLRSKGYGVAKGIPTLIVAVSGIDDALSVALFGIISSVMFSDRGLAYQISQAPVCIIGGLGAGIIWGYIARIFPEKGDSYVVPLRTITLFVGGLFFIYGSDKVGYEGAGPLATVFAAFVSNLFWCKQGWTVDENPVSTAFEIFWMIFEPILFGITGATVKFKELDPDIVSTSFGIIACAVVFRIVCTSCIAFGDRLNTKEKIFVGIAWMAKATVQAALAPVAMKNLGPKASANERHYAHVLQTVCVLSIVLTAPLGAILISISGSKLLTKTKQPPNIEGWRRSHRPSIRDISIIDEEEEREDPETPTDPLDKTTQLNQQNVSNNVPYIISK